MINLLVHTLTFLFSIIAIVGGVVGLVVWACNGGEE